MQEKQKSSLSDRAVAKEAEEACALPENKNGPDLAKGGDKRADKELSDFA